MVAPPDTPLALTIGDPAGIGPELIAAAWQRRAELDLPPFAVIGGSDALFSSFDVPIGSAASAEAVGEVFATALPVWRDNAPDHAPRAGQPEPFGAQVALDALETAVELTRNGTFAGIVTAPVAKAQLASIGFEHPGQTEFLADRCAVSLEETVMMLAGPSVRTVPLTIHVALADVPTRLTRQLILSRARVVHAALKRDFGIAAPRLAVTGLNPHAGEGGAFGREEIDIIAPAIDMLRAEGIDATGPHPADALFAPRSRDTFDAALCMYHDQALVPVKALDFDEGVNVTLGLPIVRTSPDHGTAFDIAGKGLADPGALVAAIRMAGEIAARRAANG